MLRGKRVTYRIEKAKGVEGFYLDIYVGYNRLTTKVASDVEKLTQLIKDLESQLLDLGFNKN